MGNGNFVFNAEFGATKPRLSQFRKGFGAANVSFGLA